MTSNWTIEAHDTMGRTFVFRPNSTEEQVAVWVARLLTQATTGGVVIYRSIVDASNKKVGDDHGAERKLGLVTKDGAIEDGLVAEGKKRLTQCSYCRITGGHDADCVVIS